MSSLFIVFLTCLVNLEEVVKLMFEYALLKKRIGRLSVSNRDIS